MPLDFKSETKFLNNKREMFFPLRISISSFQYKKAKGNSKIYY